MAGEATKGACDVRGACFRRLPRGPGSRSRHLKPQMRDRSASSRSPSSMFYKPQISNLHTVFHSRRLGRVPAAQPSFSTPRLSSTSAWGGSLQPRPSRRRTASGRVRSRRTGRSRRSPAAARQTCRQGTAARTKRPSGPPRGAARRWGRRRSWCTSPRELPAGPVLEK